MPTFSGLHPLVWRVTGAVEAENEFSARLNCVESQAAEERNLSFASRVPYSSLLLVLSLYLYSHAGGVTVELPLPG